MYIEQLIKKEECMISGFLEKGAFFLSWLVAPLFPFSLSFYILGKP
jgi:hypothetical protein